MIKSIFEKIAVEENATFDYKRQIVSISDGARSPYTNLNLTINYKSKTIKINNQIGTTAVGRVTSLISRKKLDLEFRITTRSHFLNLFYRNNHRFKISTNNNFKVKNLFKNNLTFNQLKKIADTTQFEPTFIGQNNNDGFTVITEYHLQFNNWHEVIQPLILFYKEFIDQIEDYNRN